MNQSERSFYFIRFWDLYLHSWFPTCPHPQHHKQSVPHCFVLALTSIIKGSAALHPRLPHYDRGLSNRQTAARGAVAMLWQVLWLQVKKKLKMLQKALQLWPEGTMNCTFADLSRTREIVLHDHKLGTAHRHTTHLQQLSPEWICKQTRQSGARQACLNHETAVG